MRFGDRLAMQGHGDSAVAVYTVAMNRYNNRMPLNEKIACIRAHQRASDYWLNRGANLNALQVLMGARDISEAAGTDSLTIGILNNKAYVYMTFQNYEKAAAIFSDAYSLMSQKKNDDAAFRILNNLASVHIMLGDIDNDGKELRSRTGSARRHDSGMPCAGGPDKIISGTEPPGFGTDVSGPLRATGRRTGTSRPSDRRSERTEPIL